MKTVAAIHTVTAMVETTKQLFAEHLPKVRLLHIADDSLIQDVIQDGEVAPCTARRLTAYYFAAASAGADLILNTCSSVGEVADAASPLLSIPIVKIDEAMTSQAVTQATRIGVLATLPTTLGPTVRLIQKQAQSQAKTIEIVEGLAEGAFAAVMAGDATKHDTLISATAKRIADQVDLIVLAQGSMARMEANLATEIGKPVLSSPVSGVLALKQRINPMS